MEVEIQFYFKIIAREIDLANFCQVTTWHYYINKYDESCPWDACMQFESHRAGERGYQERFCLQSVCFPNSTVSLLRHGAAYGIQWWQAFQVASEAVRIKCRAWQRRGSGEDFISYFCNSSRRAECMRLYSLCLLSASISQVLRPVGRDTRFLAAWKKSKSWLWFIALIPLFPSMPIRY